MRLKLYRRHTTDCIAKLAIGVRTYESDEGRRGAKKCVCLIHASGTLNRFYRKCTNQFAWEEAKRVAAQWEAKRLMEGRAGNPVLRLPGSTADVQFTFGHTGSGHG